jgi:8-oxo-dGTP diphosphatase
LGFKKRKVTGKLITPTVVSDSYEVSITVDCAVFGFHEGVLKVLLVKRSIAPYKDHWLLPGGVMEENQTLEATVDQVLFHLTGMSDIHQEQVKIYSRVDRHPAKRVVTVCFYALVKPENHPVIAKNHISEVAWFPINAPLPSLAFDHATLFADAHETLKRNLKRRLLFGELLADAFTLKELQDLYESILNEQLDRRNFRKKMMQLDLLEATGEKKIGVRGGPELYRIKRQSRTSAK